MESIYRSSKFMFLSSQRSEKWVQSSLSLKSSKEWLSTFDKCLALSNGTLQPMRYPPLKTFRSSLRLFRNSSTDCTVVFLKNSTIPVRLCISYCDVYLSISDAYIVNFNRFASSSARACNSVAFIARSFNLFGSAISLSLSNPNYSITMMKLISGLGNSIHSVNHG